MPELYTYAVARIRAKELSLLNRQDIDQLMAAGSEEECLRLLEDKGWEATDGASAMLEAELDKTWALIRELAPDDPAFAIFLLPTDYHNGKAAVKAAATNVTPDGIFLKSGSIAPEKLEDAVRRRDFSQLPAELGEAMEEAFQTLLRTGDGQLCDIMLDRACLEAVQKAGERTDCALLRDYAELTVATADIKILVRCVKTGKTADFMRRAVVPCATLQVDSLIAAALKGEEELQKALSFTRYSEAAQALQTSAAAFEKWCDNAVIALIRGEKANPFTVGPLAAYLLARENEVKIVRLILAAKRNRLDDAKIKERVRDLYV